MIIYFTGTGNSKFVADFLADKLDDEVLSLNHIIKNKEKLVCNSEKPYIFVAPIYAWRLPHKVEEILRTSELNGSKKVYCVATMGENSGKTDEYVRKIFTDKEMDFTGFIGVPMQNNYLLMETMPDETAVCDGISNIIPKLESIAVKIKQEKPLCKDDKTPLAALMSGFVNWGFNNFMLKNQKYSVSEKCILCGKCIELCPVNNITENNRNIVFDNNCMACFACLHKCPVQAINIKGKTENRGRYVCPDYTQWKSYH